MNNKIIQLINHYHNNNLPIDDYLFYDLIDILIDEYNLKGYVDLIIFTKKKATCYNYNLKIMYINYNDLYKTHYFLCNENKDILLSKEKDILLYYLCIETIFHEFIHVQQHHSMEKNINNIENRLVNLSCIRHNKELQLKYNYELFAQALRLEYLKKDTFYLLTPTERMANIKGMTQCIQLIKEHQLSDSFKKLFQYKKFLYEKNGYYINSNHHVISPLEQYLNISHDIANKIDFSDDELNIKDKILYGLNINYDELKNYFNKPYTLKMKR